MSVRRRVAGLVARAAVVASVATLGAGWALSLPTQSHIGAPPPELAAEPVDILVAGGYPVAAWYSPGRAGGGAVLLLHGVRADRRAMLGRALFLHQQGYGVLLVDLRAHGETRGSRVTFGARESDDAATALRFLRAHAPEERVGVIGFSLGGAAALLGDGPLDVDALVLEAVYPTIEDATSNRIRMYLGALAPVITPLLTWQVPLWSGLPASALRPIDAIARSDAPLLLIAGERDRRTPLHESRRLFAAARDPKELWVVPDADHKDFHATHRAEYERRVGAFLRERLQTPK